MSSNTTIFNTVSIFVFLLSVLFLNEKITKLKLLALILCISGVGILQLFASDDSGSNPSLGIYIHIYIYLCRAIGVISRVIQIR